jgi:hypothetical protein
MAPKAAARWSAPQPLVGTGVGVRSVPQQPVDRVHALVVGSVHEGLVEHVLRDLARRLALQPADISRVGAVPVRVGDQSARPSGRRGRGR